MNLEVVKKALKEINDSIDLTCTWFQIQKDVKIKIESGDESDWDTPADLEIETYHFIATFFESIYNFQIDKIDIANGDINIYGLEGDSNLFASFEELIEDQDNWNVLKLISTRFEQLEQLASPL